MPTFKDYNEWCTKKGLKPDREPNLIKFLSLIKKA